MNNAIHLEKTLRNGNPRGNPLNARKCGAKTRSGAPCKGPAVRGKRRCRMHGGNNPGRPRDPFVQELKYHRLVMRYSKKMCENCTLISNACFKVYSGDCTPANFEQKIQKYCLVSIRGKRII